MLAIAVRSFEILATLGSLVDVSQSVVEILDTWEGLALAVFIGVAVSKLPPLVPREVLFGNPNRISPRLSPDGSKMAYLAPEEGVMNVWVRSLEKADDRPLTRDRGRGIQEFFWAEDSRRIIYVQDRDGDENWHLWSADLERPNVIRDLTPFLGVQAAALETHPDLPSELLVLLNLRDRRLRDVHRINLDSGAMEVVEENPGSAVGWLVDSDFQVRGRFDSTDDGGFALFVRVTTDAPWREIARWPMTEIGNCIGFTPDGKGLYIIDSRGRDTSALIHVDLDGNPVEELAHDPEYDIGGAVVHPRTQQIQVVSWSKDRSHAVPIDPEIVTAWNAARKLDDGDMTLVSRDRSDTTWLIAFLHDDGPIRYFTFDRKNARGQFLFVHRDELVGLSLATMRPIEFVARDGLKIRGYLSLPPGSDGSPAPLVLNPHGGPWVRDTWGFDPTTQWLSNRGFAVLQVNFRGSTGYGKAFLHAGDKEWGRKMQHDLTDAVGWAIDQKIADPSRIAIMGGSYGGYAALAGIAFTPDSYAAAVDVVGPSSLFTLIDSIPPYWEPVKKKMLMQVGDPETEPDLLRERSPLFHVDKIRTPLLIGQGANDPRVKEQESEQIVEAMRGRDKEVIYVLFPDEGHGFARPENRLQFYGIVEEFLTRHLGGRSEPLPEDSYGGSGEIR